MLSALAHREPSVNGSHYDNSPSPDSTEGETAQTFNDLPRATKQISENTST